MGGAVSAGENNDELIDNLLRADYIRSPDVERVFRAVDRAHYFTHEFQDNAYKDVAWRNGHLHLSAPCVYSEVMENLCLSPGLSFLNLGSGTGYLSTMAGLILGPYGINHGIEIHHDVITYAICKLEDFKKSSPALDEYEFCEPKFINGNCLNLGSDLHQYDRVYCGAACPENHESYMKNLIKIGGVLVMPLNDNLVRITRTSETVWQSKTVLPVSFAPLLPPEQNGVKELIFLPDSEPLSLQDACRSSIRNILRHNIEIENPGIKNRRRQILKKKMRKQALRRYVIPIFEGSDTETFGHGFDTSDDEEIGERIGERAMRRRNHQITAVIEFAHTRLGLQHVNTNLMDLNSSVSTLSPEVEENQLASMSCSNSIAEDTEESKSLIDMSENIGECQIQNVCEDSSENSNNLMSLDSIEEDPNVKMSDNPAVPSRESNNTNGNLNDSGPLKKIPKRKKSDSGVGDEIETGKDLSTDSDNEDYQTYMEASTDSDFSDATPAVKRTYQSDVSGQTNIDPENERNVDPVEGGDKPPLRHRKGNNRSREKVVCRKFTVELDDESDERSEDSIETTMEPVMDTQSDSDDVHSYSNYMRLKIHELPLPPSLKDFLNLYRDF